MRLIFIAFFGVFIGCSKTPTCIKCEWEKKQMWGGRPTEVCENDKYKSYDYLKQLYDRNIYSNLDTFSVFQGRTYVGRCHK